MAKNVLLMRPLSPIQKVIPIGLLYLGAYLKKSCPEVNIKIFDYRLLDLQSYAGLHDHLGGFIPDIIGISSLSMEILEAKALAEQCRKTFPGALIVLGGPASSTDYDVIERLGLFDRIVVGEGEEILKALVNMTVNDASTVLFAANFPAVDINFIQMPDYSLIHLPDYFMRDSSHEAFQKYRKYVPVFTTRGCPFSCGFCFHLFGKKVRFRDIENICREVKFLVQTYGIQELHIEDDVFNLDKERVRRFFDFIGKENIRLAVSFPNGIIYRNVDEEFVKLMKNGGVYRVSFGIESTSDRIMTMISKRHDLGKLAEVIHLFDKYHILTHGFLITDFPTEAESDLDDTIQFILKSKLHTFRFNNYIPFKGTPLFERFNHLFKDQSIKDTGNASYQRRKNYSNIPEEVIKAKIRSATLKFYLNPFRALRIIIAMNKKVLSRWVLRKAWLYISRARS